MIPDNYQDCWFRHSLVRRSNPQCAYQLKLMCVALLGESVSPNLSSVQLDRVEKIHKKSVFAESRICIGLMISNYSHHDLTYGVLATSHGLSSTHNSSHDHAYPELYYEDVPRCNKRGNIVSIGVPSWVNRSSTKCRKTHSRDWVLILTT